MWSALLAAVVVSCLSMGSALAQLVPGPSASPSITASPETPQGKDASLSHSALKATTFKIGSTAANLAVLSYAAGGVVGGATLAGFMLASSWVLYTVNDYVWDRVDPPLAKQSADQPFDPSAEVWSTTKKFLTFKPLIATVKLAALYLYTGSASVTLVFGTAAILTNTGVFYLNNIAWDWYDWYMASPPATAAARP
jgi:uncharacterized membrane protein